MVEDHMSARAPADAPAVSCREANPTHEVPAAEAVSKNGIAPCPFCCGVARLVDFDGMCWQVECADCGSQTRECDAPEEAAEAWNRRPATSATHIVQMPQPTQDQREFLTAILNAPKPDLNVVVGGPRSKRRPDHA